MFKNKTYIRFFLLAIFVSIRLAGLHELTHSNHESIEDCEICDCIISTNYIPFITSESVVFEPLLEQSPSQVVTCKYYYQYYKDYFCNSLFSRPPPII